MSVEITRAVLTRYIDSEHTDLSTLSDDVIFTNDVENDLIRRGRIYFEVPALMAQLNPGS